MTVNNIVNKGYYLAIANQSQDYQYELLLLSQQEALSQYDNEYTSLIQEFGVLQSQYNQGESFFYKIECFDSPLSTKNLLFNEFGFGEILKRGSKYYFKRNKITSLTGQIRTSYNPASPFIFPENSFIVCSSFIPKTFQDLSAFGDSVLSVSNNGATNVIQLEDYTVLGKLNGSLQSLDIDELRQIFTDAIIRGIIESSTGNYTFLCQTLNLANSNSRLSSAALQARPVYNTSNRPAPQRGSIIYNEQTNRFEGYDGTAWRPFAWASGIGPPYDNT